MLKNLPKWTQSPFLVMPFFALWLTVPILIGISDRAATFAGGLTSGLAAVIAVILTGEVQRANEHTRHKREKAATMLSKVRMLKMFVFLVKTNGHALIEEMEKFAAAQSTASNTRSLAAWQDLVEGIFPQLPNETYNSGMEMTDAVVNALTGYVACSAHIKQLFRPLPAAFGIEIVQQFLKRARVAEAMLDALETELSAFRMTIDADVSI